MKQEIIRKNEFLENKFTLKVKYQNRILRMEKFLFPFMNFSEMSKEIQIDGRYSLLPLMLCLLR
jgi:hypothetical protein